MAKFGMQQVSERFMSHCGDTYVTSSAQDAEEMVDNKHVLRMVQGFKDTCDAEAEKAEKKIKYYHVTVMAVYEEATA